ncbi:hypothetical protein IEN85_08000 [Pelagicoccus sp. NFK12]|uniref:Uncharacterized protein n=1 Tax=Pelagicoccus enzymogenes TaxID=2773457 RepID=A0A927F7R9_9BACT|nr:hypothetical protein [Pelagicoccus enzymogenes]MBD5779434.1 hypothetical protein [Pelagicoccus enzymogenes]
MIYRLLVYFSFLTTSLAGADLLLVIQGAPGADQFAEGFSKAAALWLEMGEKAGADTTIVSPQKTGENSKQQVKQWIVDAEKSDASSIWIVYLGHGTANASGAKLNLPGEDLSAKELSEWLANNEKEIVFVHGGSASSPFISALSAENRVIITATRSPSELNYARFGERFAEAMAAPASDIDRDHAVSLLEAFLSASAATETFYRDAGRLSSEHALIDDNGDGKGTPATQYSGLRSLPQKETGPALDGRLARRISLIPQKQERELTPSQAAERNKLEQELESLYSNKNDLPVDEYYQRLEAILNELSQFYLSDSES